MLVLRPFFMYGIVECNLSFLSFVRVTLAIIFAAVSEMLYSPMIDRIKGRTELYAKLGNYDNLTHFVNATCQRALQDHILVATAYIHI